MVKPFQFSRLPKIYFKSGMLSELTSLVQQYGSNVVIVTGKNSFIDSKYAEKLFNDFKKKSISYTVISIAGEPSPEIIDEAVKNSGMKILIL